MPATVVRASLSTDPSGPLVGLADLSQPMAALVLRLGKIRLRIRGQSMEPTLSLGDEVVVEPETAEGLAPGEMALFEQAGRLVCHRIVRVDIGEDGSRSLVTRGDAAQAGGEQVAASRVFGRVVLVRRAPWWRRRLAIFVVGLRNRWQFLACPGH